MTDCTVGFECQLVESVTFLLVAAVVEHISLLLRCLAMIGATDHRRQ